MDDLQRICQSIAKSSSPYARVVATRIYTAAERLKQFPNMGPLIRGRHDALGQVFVYRYRMVYRCTADSVQIVRIIHGARESGNLPPKDEGGPD